MFFVAKMDWEIIIRRFIGMTPLAGIGLFQRLVNDYQYRHIRARL